MALLRACLFQTLHIETGQGRPLDLGSPTGRSLFAYLLLHRERPSDRRRLAFVFWPNASESAARRNLRQYLHRTRRLLEPVGFPGELLLADGSSVQINPQADIWTDVDTFRWLSRPEAGEDALREAVDLYRGELLEDVYEDWPAEERRRLRQLYLKAINRLCSDLLESGQIELSATYARHWADSEPFDEEAQRRLMTLLSLNGDRNLAIQHYHAFAERLSAELGAEPMPETRALMEAIQLGSLRKPAGAAQPSHPILFPPQPVPGAATSPAETVAGWERGSAAVQAEPLPAQSIFPLVGRDGEITRLEATLAASAQGACVFVLVSGESGVGKTRLVQEYLDRHPELPALQGICHELEAAVPYAPLRRLLPEALDISPEKGLPETLVALIHQLGSRPPASTDHTAEADTDSELADRYCRLVIDLSRQFASPLHLVLDDLHWGDNPTWEFLASLVHRAAGLPLVVLGICRLEDLPPERSRLIRQLERSRALVNLPLRRLSATETAMLARNVLPEKELDALFISRLYQETEGNPFFIIEIMRAANEAGRRLSLPLETGAGTVVPPGLPLSIQRVIEARLERLSPPSQELLATAAAMGSSFTLPLLEEASQLSASEVVDAIEEWVQRGLVHEDSYGYDFSHDKIRQVAYADLSRARRQFIHRRIATVLETVIPPVDPATLAHHYARSDQPLKALPHLTEAGEQALHLRSYQEARQFGLQALNLLSRTPGPQKSVERLDLNLQLAQAYAFAGDMAHAQELLSEGERLALSLNEEERLGKILYRSAQVFWLRGQPGQAGDYARRTLRAAEELNDQGLLLAALRMLGRVGIAVSAFDDAIAYLLRYANLAEAGHIPLDLPIVLGYLGVAYARVGSWSRAFDAARRGVSLAENRTSLQIASLHNRQGENEAAFARMQLGFVYADRGDWQACQDLLAEIPVAEENEEQDPVAGITPLIFMLQGLRGRVSAHLGQPQQALALIRPALAWAEQADYRVFHYLPRLFMAESLLLAGQIDAAHQEAERALEQALQGNNRWAAAITLRLLAEILTRLPNPDWVQVENHLIESMHTLRQVRARPDLARTYLALRRLYDRAGQIAWAVDCHFRATSIFEELGMGEELRLAQGQAAGDRKGAVVIPGMALRGPNEPAPSA